MSGNMPITEIKHLLGSVPAFVLMVCLTPVFFLLALLYIYIHPTRGEGAARKAVVGRLATTN
jgi:hypothetical protein